MGNYRFRFSDMLPNAWFYKLKDMNKSRKQCTSTNTFKRKPDTTPTTISQRSSISQSRYSYYHHKDPLIRADNKFYNSPIHPETPDAYIPDLPRRSSRKVSRRRTIYKPSPKLVSSTRRPVKSISVLSPEYSSSSPLESSPETEDFHEYPLSESDREDDGFSVTNSFVQVASWSSSCDCKVSSSDIIIDMDGESFETKTNKVNDGFDRVPDLDLPPILTKPATLFEDEMSDSDVSNFKRGSTKLEECNAQGSHSVRIVKQGRIRTHRERKTNPVTRKFSSNSPGIRLRSNSPRIASRKIQSSTARKSISSRNKILSESFAVVKSSIDPLKDFKDSMVEMIIENKIEATKDLEDLLACYLSLNAKEYHDLIIKAFEQIWFDMTDLCL